MAGRQQFALDYIDVAERIATFREKHPDGSMQQVSLEFREVGNRWWVIYTAAAYRTPDDERPGIGTAWEPIPGATNFTRDSEVQNAETAAWGRAIVAALAGDTKRSIASAEEVRNRQADREAVPELTRPVERIKGSPGPDAWTTPDPLADAKRDVWAAAQAAGIPDAAALSSDYTARMGGRALAVADEATLREYLALLQADDAGVVAGGAA